MLDVNENLHTPVFPDPVLAATIQENLPTGSKVTKLNATDQDVNTEDSRISYRIVGGDGIGNFGVDDEG